MKVENVDISDCEGKPKDREELKELELPYNTATSYISKNFDTNRSNRDLIDMVNG